jgi:APA family basic amino acid/polyamine antiporter
VAEEIAFARKASGLVRGMSMLDAFAVGFMNQGLTPGAMLTVTLGVGTFMGANLYLTVLISVILAGIGFPLVWGILGGSMPRSGGEYVYNSRIFHPVIGIAQSFGDALIWMAWIFAITPLLIDPGFSMLCAFVGWDSASEWALGGDWQMWLLSSIFNAIAFAFVVFGMKIFALAQKIIMFFGLGGAVVMGIVMTVTSSSGFAEKWQAWAGTSTGDFINAVAADAGDIPSKLSWGLTTDTIGAMVAASWLFAYAYSISFIAGEVKRPDKSIVWANVLAIAIPCAFMLWFAFGLYNSVGFQFNSAAAYNDNSGEIAATADLPWGTNIVGLAAIMVGDSAGGQFVAALMALSYMAFTLWLVTLSYLAFPRILFAWGMDRMGPKWFTDINPRFASPVKNHILCLVLGEALITLYAFGPGDKMANIAITGMQIASVFAITALAAILFPYVKRAKGIWDSSPYKKWTFIGLPVSVWGGVINMIYLGILMYGLIALDATAAWEGYMVYAMIGSWILGVAWYFFWKAKSKSVGVDVSVTYGELPPD